MVDALVLSPTDAVSQDAVVGSAQRVVVARAWAPRDAGVQHCSSISTLELLSVNRTATKPQAKPGTVNRTATKPQT